jgi:hypothetical protein
VAATAHTDRTIAGEGRAPNATVVLALTGTCREPVEHAIT